MDDIKITTLSPTEWEQYKNIRLRSLQEEPQAYLSSYAGSSQELDKKWRERLELAEKGERQWLSFARMGETLVGMAGAFLPEGSETPEIISVFVGRKVRNRGVGKRLMNHLLETIKQNPHIKKVHLEVNSTQPAAVKLYESCGFRITGKTKRVLGDGVEYEDLLMELPLVK